MNEIPAIVFQGTDSCSAEILESALSIYKKNGCSDEFLYDLKLLVDDFKAYQMENSHEVKLPKLTESEKVMLKADMMDETYDVFFNDATDSNSKGFSLTRDEAIEKAEIMLESGDSYVNDYTGGTISVVGNETGKTVWEKEIQGPINKSESSIQVYRDEELFSSTGKSLIADVSTSSGYDNYRILDKSTGKTEPLNVGDIDLSKQSPESIKKLLSGDKITTINNSATLVTVELIKGKAGWGIAESTSKHVAYSSQISI
ncbi:MAG: hypothetical protein LBG80_04630 [Bacteroidales bacterium]|jgi:hypothetical protein|nr:hypothetical protein [Bacteroidales bacterium]